MTINNVTQQDEGLSEKLTERAGGLTDEGYVRARCFEMRSAKRPGFRVLAASWWNLDHEVSE